MKMIISLLLVTGLSMGASAANYKIKMKPSNIKMQNMQTFGLNQLLGFTKLNVVGFENDVTLGAPAIPVKTFLVQGTPENILVSVKAKETISLKNTRPYPAQEQDCRCVVKKTKLFSFDQVAYGRGLEKPVINYIGAFRGAALSQVTVKMGYYDNTKNETVLLTEADIEINQPQFALPSMSDYNDYLIITPSQLAPATTAFADWKKSLGYNVIVETLEIPGTTTAAVQALVTKHYRDSGTDFVIIIGDELTVPMFIVQTSDGRTTSDLKYFTMDGTNDNVPDMLTSRIAATSVDQVTAQFAKIIEFEQKSFVDSTGLKHYIGIASNEGSNPSDNEYVTAIENTFKNNHEFQVSHFYQNDSVNSNPQGLNNAFNKGAAWLTYLGHGSGNSWPSMRVEYKLNNIKQITNKTVVKPIIIDVACQNGRLKSNYLGTTFMSTDNNQAFGAAAYFGGTVNISWHPPAIMARGIAFEHNAKNFKHLGEALMAGQVYLAANWNKPSDVIDNLEWYHLQGDPGMNIQFQPKEQPPVEPPAPVEPTPVEPAPPVNEDPVAPAPEQPAPPVKEEPVIPAPQLPPTDGPTFKNI